MLSYCEHGELQGALKKRAADGAPFPMLDKYRFCVETAAGMAHLAEHMFVHRDLAARNVLLGVGMVCKVADFGLSRSVRADEDATGDYYRSSGGLLPVRWTAPEGMTSPWKGGKIKSARGNFLDSVSLPTCTESPYESYVQMSK